MIQIVYISSAVAPWSTEQLLELLQQCLKNNSARGVTGMLLYGEDTFLQALEGDDAVIDALIEKIARDPRHAKIQLLHGGRSSGASTPTGAWASSGSPSAS